MDQYLFFAVAGSVLVMLRYGTYLYTVYQGQTKPHAFTWLLLGSVSSIGAWAQFELNGGPSAWVLGLMAATCLLIALLAFFVGYRDYKKSDWAALIICFMAIPLWKATDNPVLALVIVVFIDFELLANDTEIVQSTSDRAPHISLYFRRTVPYGHVGRSRSDMGKYRISALSHADRLGLCCLHCHQTLPNGLSAARIRTEKGTTTEG